MVTIKTGTDSIIKINRMGFHFICAFFVSSFIFFVFKLYYPYPNFSPDSYTYISTAINNDPITLWPIGYPKFLQYFSFFTRTDDALVFIQYSFLMFSIFCFLIVISEFWNVYRWIIYLLYLLLAVNPLILQLSNFVGPDAIFTALTILWVIQILLIMKRPSKLLFILHAFLLLLLCMFRYNGLWYPVLSIGVILWSNYSWKGKLISIAIIILLQATFFLRNCYYYNKIVGIPMANAFGGWQMASNGLNAYAHSPVIGVEEVPIKFRKIHRIVNEHIAYMRTLPLRPDSLITTYYLWDNAAPLRRFLIDEHRKINPGNPISFKEWAQLSPLYMSYGLFLISKAPHEYVRDFLLPNLVYFFTPSGEYLAVYNMRKDYIDEPVKGWFRYKTASVSTLFKDREITSIWYISLAVGIFNCLFILAFIGFIFTGGLKLFRNKRASYTFLVLFIFTGNMLFNVFASGIILRYETFSFILTFIFSIVLLSEIIKIFNSPHKDNII